MIFYSFYDLISKSNIQLLLPRQKKKQSEINPNHKPFLVTEAGGACCFYSDDGYVVGPPDVVFPALKQFQTSLFARTNLELVEDKCEVYSKDPAIARDYLSKNPEFGKFNLGAFPDVDTTKATAGAGYGIKILGVPVGDLRYIETILTNKVTSIREDIFNSSQNSE